MRNNYRYIPDGYDYGIGKVHSVVYKEDIKVNGGTVETMETIGNLLYDKSGGCGGSVGVRNVVLEKMTNEGRDVTSDYKLRENIPTRQFRAEWVIEKVDGKKPVIVAGISQFLGFLSIDPKPEFKGDKSIATLQLHGVIEECVAIPRPHAMPGLKVFPRIDPDINASTVVTD